MCPDVYDLPWTIVDKQFSFRQPAKRFLMHPDNERRGLFVAKAPQGHYALMMFATKGRSPLHRSGRKLPTPRHVDVPRAAAFGKPKAAWE